MGEKDVETNLDANSFHIVFYSLKIHAEAKNWTQDFNIEILTH